MKAPITPKIAAPAINPDAINVPLWSLALTIASSLLLLLIKYDIKPPNNNGEFSWSGKYIPRAKASGDMPKELTKIAIIAPTM